MDKIKGNVDIMMISETKLDNTFPNGQFLIDGFSEPIRLDRLDKFFKQLNVENRKNYNN